MNNVVLIGRLARDPELSYTPNQTAVCKFTLAVDRPKVNGEDKGADFIRITAWGKTAETSDKYLYKGKQVAVIGRIQTGSYKNKNGDNVYTTDVVADKVEFLGDSKKSDTEEVENNIKETFEGVPFTTDDMAFEAVDDGIPF